MNVGYSLLIFLGLIILFSEIINKVLGKGRFFNGGYLFLLFALVSIPIHLYGAYEAHRRAYLIGQIIGSWIIPVAIALYVGRKFRKSNPFSFPSVLWTAKEQIAKEEEQIALQKACTPIWAQSTQSDVHYDGTSTEDSKQADDFVPSWMKGKGK
jgi:hypothetical protein